MPSEARSLAGSQPSPLAGESASVEADEKSALRSVRPRAVSDAGDCGEAYRLWRDPVWRTLGRLGVGRDALPDATHDVFEVAFRRWNDFEGRSSRKTWVFGIAVRVAHGYRRRRHRREVLEEPFVLEASGNEPQWGTRPFGDQEAWTAQREASATLRHLLQGLSANHREVLVPVDLEGLSVVEAAAALAINYRAASRRLDRARANFNLALRRHHTQAHGVKP